MSTVVNQVRRGFFLDSVALMRHSRTIASLDGVEEAALMMGTAANKEIMADAGLLAAEGGAAGGGDLVIGIRAGSAKAAKAALAESGELLERPAAAPGAENQWRPRTIRAAVEALPGANLALISVPGDYAAAEARKALRRGLNVMIFSDNVALADELELKQEARELGRLVMGPDCGTAIIGGVPLAFANRVPRGHIGIIGASGTGIQEVSCLIARGGGGVSHAIGVGGRDLKSEIGGITTLMAIDALDADPATRHVVLISKPPAPEVAARIIGRVGESAKSFTICFIGARDIDLPTNARLATTLKAAAMDALGGAATGSGFGAAALARHLPAGRGVIRGLFSGGTLAAEAQVVFRAAGEAVTSNAPIPGVPTLGETNIGHPMIDLGDDEYTRGRPHPMIDPEVREEALRDALADPTVGAVLLDVVIGYGAHADPAGDLARVLAERAANGPLMIASVTGTDEDPQNRAAQVVTLAAAEVLVAPSNADAAELALACLRAAG